MIQSTLLPAPPVRRVRRQRTAGTPYTAAVDELILSIVRPGRKRLAYLRSVTKDSFTSRELAAHLNRLSSAGKITCQAWPACNDVLIGVPR